MLIKKPADGAGVLRGEPVADLVRGGLQIVHPAHAHLAGLRIEVTTAPAFHATEVDVHPQIALELLQDGLAARRCLAPFDPQFLGRFLLELLRGG